MIGWEFPCLSLQQTATRRKKRLSRILGDKFDSIDQKQRYVNTERMLYVQQHLLDVFEDGTQIHDAQCKLVYFQTCEIGEWTMRDVTAFMLDHGLPHMNRSQAFLTYFQHQNTRARLMTYGVHLPLVSVALRNLCCDLQRGIVYPGFIFAKLFSAGQWGMYQTASFLSASMCQCSENVLCENSGRRELQLLFVEWRLPVFANFFTVEGAIEYLSQMHESQRDAMFNPTTISNLIGLLDRLDLVKGNSGVVRTFRQLLSKRMIDFYAGVEMTESRKTKMGTKYLKEWGAMYHTNSEGSRKHFIVCATIPIFAGGEKGTFFDIEDEAMNFYTPSFVDRVLQEPPSLTVEDMDFPGVDTAGRLILIQMPRGQFTSALSVMEYHGAEMYAALVRAGIDMYSSHQRVFGLSLPEFGDKNLRKVFIHNMIGYERNERLRLFFQRDEPSTTTLRPVVALVVIMEVCSCAQV